MRAPHVSVVPRRMSENHLFADQWLCFGVAGVANGFVPPCNSSDTGTGTLKCEACPNGCQVYSLSPKEPDRLANERAYYLYFTEFPLNTSWCKANGLQTSSGMDTFGFMQTGCERSVLNLAEVHYAPNVTGGPALSVNRNETFEFTMVPPPNRKSTTQQRPTVWHVTVEDAMVIALAELNRWVPTALYDLSTCSDHSMPAAGVGMPTCGPPPPPVATLDDRDDSPPRRASTRRLTTTTTTTWDEDFADASDASCAWLRRRRRRSNGSRLTEEQ